MQRKLLANGNVSKRTDGRWGGVVWYMDEQGNAQSLDVSRRVILAGKEIICTPKRILQKPICRRTDI